MTDKDTLRNLANHVAMELKSLHERWGRKQALVDHHPCGAVFRGAVEATRSRIETLNEVYQRFDLKSFQDFSPLDYEGIYRQAYNDEHAYILSEVIGREKK